MNNTEYSLEVDTSERKEEKIIDAPIDPADMEALKLRLARFLERRHQQLDPVIYASKELHERVFNIANVEMHLLGFELPESVMVQTCDDIIHNWRNVVPSTEETTRVSVQQG